MVDAHAANSKYGLLLYNSVPVESQKRVNNGEIKVTFHDGKVIFVSPDDWIAQKEYVFISRSLGSREHIIKNWQRYRDQVSKNPFL